MTEDRAGNRGDAPPASHGDAPVPPTPFAAQYGVVRPLQGRYVAGVCAALGRATRTDPVLWRVVLAVLVCFGGVGALVYLAVWLVTPEEGDTASPAEALVGKGSSNTSPVLTVVLGLIAAGLLIFVLSRQQYLVLGGAVALAALLLGNRLRNQPAPPAPPEPPAAGTTPATAPSATGAPAPTDPTLTDPTRTGAPPTDPTLTDPTRTGAAPTDPTLTDPTRTDAAPTDRLATTDAVPPTEPVSPDTPPLPSVFPTPPPADLPPPTAPLPPPGPTATGYRPPFAPHGPFAGPPVPPPVRPPRPPRERSALPAIVFFSSLMALGFLGMLDLVGAVDVPTSGYLAGALAVIGTGLVVGTWLGRARSLIALGAVLALALPAVHVAEVWDRPEYFADDYTWRPATTAELEEEYELMFGSAELNLTGIDFTGQQVEVAVDLSFGDVKVIVPPDVAVTAEVDSRLGSTTVFGETIDGLADDTIRHPGSGDPADGTLRLDLRNRAGNLEVLGR